MTTWNQLPEVWHYTRPFIYSISINHQGKPHRLKLHSCPHSTDEDMEA